MTAGRPAVDKARFAWVQEPVGTRASRSTARVDRPDGLVVLHAKVGQRAYVRSIGRVYVLTRTRRAENYPRVITPFEREEEFILRVCWSTTPNHLVRRDEVMADVGCPPPDPPLTGEEMQRVTRAAKTELLRVLRLRKTHWASVTKPGSIRRQP